MYKYGIYSLEAMNGRLIRKAAYVKDLDTGEIVRFIDLLGKKRAYAQAYEIFKWRAKRNVD